MDGALSEFVRQRAGQRCECCGLAQSDSALRYHIEHSIPRQHAGSSSPDNLALACPECNFQKGTNLAGFDPDTGLLTRLFNPRTDRWDDHFHMNGARIVGDTPVGRTTAQLLEMNTGDRIRWRDTLGRSE